MQEKQFWQALEEYIDTHRTALDVDEPRPDMWAQIAEKIPETRKGGWWQPAQLWRVAAMIMIALGLSYWWYTRLGDGKPTAVMADMGHDWQPGAGMESSQEEWNKVQQAYQPALDSLESVKGIQAADNELLQRVNHSLDSLEAAGPATAERVEALGQLLEQKKQILLQAN